MGKSEQTPPAASSAAKLVTLPLASEQFRQLVEQVKDYAIFVLDPEGYIASWTAGAERIKGYTPQEIIGKHFSVFYTKEDIKAGVPERELEIARTLGSVDQEGWRLRKDGTRFWASVTITAMYDSSGVLTGFGKVTRDVTERRNAEEALHKSRNMFERLFENAPDAVVVIDHLGLEQPFAPPAPKEPWHELPLLLALAANPNVVVKITGACTLSHEKFPYKDIWDPLGRIFDAFTLDRCMWGTDWTRAVALLTYKEGVDSFRVTDRLSDSDRVTLMGGALQKIYGWSPKKG